MLTISSLNLPAQIAWTVYTTGNSSLPDNSVRCISFENDSTTWIGTDFGLVKMVNGTITNYNTANSGLTNNTIRSLAIDKNGLKYIGTFVNGLNTFNDTVWTSYSTTNSPLPDDYVRSINIDTNGTRWIGTTGGLVKLDSLNNWTIYTMWNSVLGSSNIAAIYIDELSNDKWVGTVNGGCLLIEKDTNLTSFTIQNSGISDNTILGIDQDAVGNIFMSSPANGLIVKLNGFGWVTYNTISSSIPTAGLSCVKLDSIDQPWIGTIDKGLLYKDGSTFLVFDTSNSPLTDINIQCVNIDDQGRVWIGTQSGGLYILDPSLLTGISQQPANTNVIVYPNPANDQLFVAGNNKINNVRISDTGGRILLHQNFGDNKQIDVSSLTGGMYNAVFRLDNGLEVTKIFIKQ